MDEYFHKKQDEFHTLCLPSQDLQAFTISHAAAPVKMSLSPEVIVDIMALAVSVPHPRSLTRSFGGLSGLNG